MSGARRTTSILSWANPDQGVGEPDRRRRLAHRRARPATTRASNSSPATSSVPCRTSSCRGPASSRCSVWLRDEAGNEASASAISVPLRFDDVPPRVAFEPPAAGDAAPTQVRGPDHRRPLRSGQRGNPLPAARQPAVDGAAGEIQPGGSADTAQLLARLPGDLGPGTYVFRADAVDGAGNAASSTRRADGTEMTVRKVAGAAGGRGQVGPGAAEAPRGEDADLRPPSAGTGASGTELTVPFGAAAMLSGRLVSADGRRARRPHACGSSPGLRAAPWRRRASTRSRPASHGGFRLRAPRRHLAPGRCLLSAAMPGSTGAPRPADPAGPQRRRLCALRRRRCTPARRCT